MRSHYHIHLPSNVGYFTCPGIDTLGKRDSTAESAWTKYTAYMQLIPVGIQTHRLRTPVHRGDKLAVNAGSNSRLKSSIKPNFPYLIFAILLSIICK